MRSRIVGGVLALALAPALALPVRAETISLSLADAINILAALEQLDGYDKVVKDGAAERVVKISYQLSGQIRLAIAKDLTHLRSALEMFKIARAGKIEEIVGANGTLPPGSEAETKLGKEITLMLSSKQNFDLVRLSSADLGLLPPSNNPIPATVLERLSVVFESEVK